MRVLSPRPFRETVDFSGSVRVASVCAAAGELAGAFSSPGEPGTRDREGQPGKTPLEPVDGLHRLCWFHRDQGRTQAGGIHPR
jgi:hypothetical protein